MYYHVGANSAFRYAPVASIILNGVLNPESKSNPGQTLFLLHVHKNSMSIKKKKKRWGEKEGEVPVKQSEEHIVLG